MVSVRCSGSHALVLSNRGQAMSMGQPFDIRHAELNVAHGNIRAAHAPAPAPAPAPAHIMHMSTFDIQARTRRIPCHHHTKQHLAESNVASENNTHPHRTCPCQLPIVAVLYVLVGS